jgi:hypothetical protein
MYYINSHPSREITVTIINNFTTKDAENVLHYIHKNEPIEIIFDLTMVDNKNKRVEDSLIQMLRDSNHYISIISLGREL